VAARRDHLGPDAHSQGTVIEVDSRVYPNLAAFAWQEGYSVFSVSKSQEGAVKAYIAGQAEPQKKEDFKSELLRILLAHGVEFDEKYVLN